MPGPLVHPGEMLLEEFLRLSAVASRGSRQAKVDPLGLQQSVVADELGISRNRLTELVLGKRAVTADTAIRLERRFKMPARFWLHLQADHDLQTALNEEGSARRGARRTTESRVSSTPGMDVTWPVRMSGFSDLTPVRKPPFDTAGNG